MQEDVELFRRGIELLAELYRAAGAKRIFLPLDATPEGDAARAACARTT